MLTGRDLIKDVDATTLSAGECAFWWMGQLSYILKVAGAVLYLDPYLSPSKARTTPPLLAPGEVTNAAVITGSHDHGDHIDRPVWPALAQASPKAKFVVPELLRKKMAAALRMPEDRFVGLDDSKTVEIAGVRLTGVAAAHEQLDQDAASGRYPYLGYLIEADGLRIYHAGDTCKYEGLETRLKRAAPIDLALLPINGRDAVRFRGNCIGNMTYQEAVDLAGAAGVRLAVPSHWDMFKNNSEDPQKFVDYMAAKFPKVRTLIPKHGQRVLWRADGCPLGDAGKK
ncbi:MAG: MBL fold metallo-hydrolase [Planctomycetota bacterium]|nr:MBL fold metallo-hydrolase [Planctomycetota bacterium]